jgi:hypothetical protein
MTSPRAVRVCTVNDESRYVVARNIPAIGVVDEALKKLSLFGTILAQRTLEHDDLDERFTESLWLEYETLNNARHAKRGMQHKTVYGSVLSVAYAPQDERPEDTASKLQLRRELLERRAAPRSYRTRTPCPVAEMEVAVDPEFIGPQLPPRPSVQVVQAADIIAPPTNTDKPSRVSNDRAKRRRI